MLSVKRYSENLVTVIVVRNKISETSSNQEEADFVLHKH